MRFDVYMLNFVAYVYSLIILSVTERDTWPTARVYVVAKRLLMQVNTFNFLCFLKQRNGKGTEIQGVPKVRSSNFMHYNFWSKLYFYMKFLEDVYFSIKYMYSEFQ